MMRARRIGTKKTRFVKTQTNKKTATTLAPIFRRGAARGHHHQPAAYAVMLCSSICNGWARSVGSITGSKRVRRSEWNIGSLFCVYLPILIIPIRDIFTRDDLDDVGQGFELVRSVFNHYTHVIMR